MQRDTYFYCPWINSNYHHQITEYGINGIYGNNDKPRRKSITDTYRMAMDTPPTTYNVQNSPSLSATKRGSIANKKRASSKKRISRQFVHNGIQQQPVATQAAAINFNAVTTRQPSHSVSGHQYNPTTPIIKNDSPTPIIDLVNTPALNAISSGSTSFGSVTPETVKLTDNQTGSSNSSTLYYKNKRSSNTRKPVINTPNPKPPLDPEIKNKLLFDNWIHGPSMLSNSQFLHFM